MAEQILVVGGMSLLFFGLLLGIPMIATRSRKPRAPRYLFAAHLASIIQGTLLMTLTIATDFSNLSARVETVAAVLLLSGMVLFNAGLALNWLQGVEDGFAEGSIGNKISGLGTPLVLGGAAILLFGVVTA